MGFLRRWEVPRCGRGAAGQGVRRGPPSPDLRRRTTMRIAYLSTDEVNRDLACRWADERHITIDLLDRERVPADGPLDAVLCDLDYLPAEWRQQILADLLAGVPSCPAAVHGYNLDEDQAEDLREHGVLVVRRLTESVFDRLCRAVHALPRAARERQNVPQDQARPRSLAG